MRDRVSVSNLPGALWHAASTSSQPRNFILMHMITSCKFLVLNARILHNEVKICFRNASNRIGLFTLLRMLLIPLTHVNINSLSSLKWLWFGSRGNQAYLSPGGFAVCWHNSPAPHEVIYSLTCLNSQDVPEVNVPNILAVDGDFIIPPITFYWTQKPAPFVIGLWEPSNLTDTQWQCWEEHQQEW